jgi:hypothetical protein
VLQVDDDSFPMSYTPEALDSNELTGRTPRAMLRYVLRDGFEYTEEFVRRGERGWLTWTTERWFAVM